MHVKPQCLIIGSYFVLVFFDGISSILVREAWFRTVLLLVPVSDPCWLQNELLFGRIHWLFWGYWDVIINFVTLCFNDQYSNEKETQFFSHLESKFELYLLLLQDETFIGYHAISELADEKKNVVNNKAVFFMKNCYTLAVHLISIIVKFWMQQE